MYLESLSAPVTAKSGRSRQGERPPVDRTGGRFRVAPQEGPTLRRDQDREETKMVPIERTVL